MLHKIPLLCLSAIICASAPLFSRAIAQTDPPVCELHIWPTNNFVVTENLGGANMGLVGAAMDEAMKLKSPGDVQKQLQQQIGPDQQKDIINEIDLSHSFPNYRVIIERSETQPTWNMDLLKSDDSIIKPTTLCHAEMAITSIQYFHQPIGTRIRINIWYREYHNNNHPIVKIWDAAAAKAPDFPAKHFEDIANSSTSVQVAFREGFSRFVSDKLKR